MKLSEVIAQIDQNQQQIDAFGKFEDKILKKINYKLRLDWNYYSNRMEGGTLTREETRSVMVGNVEVHGKPMKDIMEMNGHDQVVREILKISKGELRISEKRIQEIHRAIMHEQDPEKIGEIGKWKSAPNEIISSKGEKISFAQPSEVKEKMHDLLNHTNAGLDRFFAGKKGLHPLEMAARFHIDFVTIHPFYDGNGRTTRILTNLLLISCGFPVIIINDQQKQVYYQLLGDIQGYGGNPELFYVFLGERLIESQALVLKAMNGGEIEEEEDFIKEIKLIKNKIENLELPKSPKLVHSVFRGIEKEVWTILSKTLDHFFDELFSDRQIKRFFNGKEEEFSNRNLLSNKLIVSTKPESRIVFGYDIYDEFQLDSVEWMYSIFGLKGSENGNFEINLKISFQINTYLVELDVNNHQISSFKKKYGNLLLSEDADTMNKRLKEFMLSEIKNRI